MYLVWFHFTAPVRSGTLTLAGVRLQFVSQAATAQQLEGAVNGGKADARVLVFYEPVQLLDGEVLAGLYSL